METGPILRAMLRSRTGPVLVALQVAVTLAVVANAVFIIKGRVDHITRDDGMEVDSIVAVTSVGIGEDFDKFDVVRRDLEALGAIPGVIAASSIQAVPLSGSGWGTEIMSSPEEGAPRINGAQYFVSADAVETLGVRLAEGRGFTEEDVAYPESISHPAGNVILTRAYADALFPDGGALGAAVYDGLGRPSAVVGILEKMHGSWPGWDKLDNVMLVPRVHPGTATWYLVRTEPGLTGRLMPRIEETLLGVSDRRVIKNLQPMSAIKARSYMADRGMAVLLGFVTGMLLVVTSVGIVGLASFSVRQRVKQIGTRRAVGARRRHVLRYFLTENWLITSAGLLIGVLLAFGVNWWLVASYELPRLDPMYVAGGALLLWLLGLAAVLGPARRAARISPAVATRSV